MIVFLVLSVIANVGLIFLVWWRFQAERTSLEAVFSLTDAEKRYVVAGMKNQTIHPCEVPESDLDMLEGLIEKNWLFLLGNETVQGGPCTRSDYLSRLLGPLSENFGAAP